MSETKRPASPREAAAKALLQMDTQEAFSNLLAASAFSGMEARDRAFAMNLFSGVLERQTTLDAALAPYLTKPMEKQDPAVRCLLRLGAYQLLYTRVPESAGVNETVALARALGRARQSGFVNAVLRSFLREGKRIPYPENDPAGYDSLFYSCPLWLVKLWRSQYGEEAAKQILASSLGPAPLYARVNTLRTTPEALIALFAQREIPAEKAGETGPLAHCLHFPRPAGVPDSDLMQQGLFHIQDPASQLCAALLDPQPGDTLVDVCAAPGGKSFTMAERMEDKGTLYSFDLYPQRAGLITEGATRLGITCIRAKAQDALVPDPALFGKADRVLCDAVCSGLGTVRRKPEIKHKPSSALDGLPELQYQILEQSARYLRPGGVLVYSTCTLNRKENQGVTKKFLQNHPEFSPDPIPVPEGYDLLLPEEGPAGLWEATLLPGVSDGFYVCRMKKSADPT